jgi:threonine dehydrogenase-like Zn-dependent dehydrogenase
MPPMRAVTIEPGVAHSVRLEDIDEPDPASGSVLVESIAVGVCGTDAELVAGIHGWAPPGRARMVLGHESLGRVLSADPSSGLAVGDLVAGIVRRPDARPCPNCAVGEWDMCRNGEYTERGIKSLDGFMSERWRIEPEFAVRVDPSLGDLGVLLEPTSVVAKAWEQIDATRARAVWDPRRVLVTGAGPVGLLAAMMAVQHGYEVHVLDQVVDGPKPDVVRALGATYHAGAVADIGFEPDVVVECCGDGQVVVDALQQVARGGVVCLIGSGAGGHTSGPGAADLATKVMRSNNLVVGIVNANRRHFDQAALALAAADRDWLARLVTRRVPVERVADALRREPGDIKVVVEFGAGS